MTSTDRQNAVDWRASLASAAIAMAALTIVAGAALDIYVRFFYAPTQTNIASYTGWDHAAIPAAQGKGLFLAFANPQGVDVDYSTFYFRAVYSLYPQPVIVAPAASVINTPRDIIRGNFHPDDSWLVEHQVPTLLTIFLRPHQFDVELHRPAPVGGVVPAATAPAAR